MTTILFDSARQLAQAVVGANSQRLVAAVARHIAGDILTLERCVQSARALLAAPARPCWSNAEKRFYPFGNHHLFFDADELVAQERQWLNTIVYYASFCYDDEIIEEVSGKKVDGASLQHPNEALCRAFASGIGHRLALLDAWLIAQRDRRAPMLQAVVRQLRMELRATLTNDAMVRHLEVADDAANSNEQTVVVGTNDTWWREHMAIRWATGSVNDEQYK